MDLPTAGEAIGLLLIVALAIYVYIKGLDKFDDDDWRNQAWQ